MLKNKYRRFKDSESERKHIIDILLMHSLITREVLQAHLKLRGVKLTDTVLQDMVKQKHIRRFDTLYCL